MLRKSAFLFVSLKKRKLNKSEKRVEQLSDTILILIRDFDLFQLYFTVLEVVYIIGIEFKCSSVDKNRQEFEFVLQSFLFLKFEKFFVDIIRYSRQLTKI